MSTQRQTKAVHSSSQPPSRSPLARSLFAARPFEEEAEAAEPTAQAGEAIAADATPSTQSSAPNRNAFSLIGIPLYDPAGSLPPASPLLGKPPVVQRQSGEETQEEQEETTLDRDKSFIQPKAGEASGSEAAGDASGSSASGNGASETTVVALLPPTQPELAGATESTATLVAQAQASTQQVVIPERERNNYRQILIRVFREVYGYSQAEAQAQADRNLQGATCPLGGQQFRVSPPQYDARTGQYRVTVQQDGYCGGDQYAPSSPSQPLTRPTQPGVATSASGSQAADPQRQPDDYAVFRVESRGQRLILVAVGSGSFSPPSISYNWQMQEYDHVIVVRDGQPQRYERGSSILLSPQDLVRVPLYASTTPTTAAPTASPPTTSTPTASSAPPVNRRVIRQADPVSRAEGDVPQILMEPPVKVAVPGTRIRYSFAPNKAVLPNVAAVYSVRWYVRNDRRTNPTLPEVYEGSRSIAWENEDWDAPGEHTVVCEAQDSTELIAIEYVQVVRPIEQVAQESLSQQQPRDYVGFRTGLELKHLELAQGGVPNQNFGVPSIANSGENPAVPRQAPDLAYHTYTITPSPRARRFRWYVEPKNPIGLQNYKDFQRQERNGREVYDLNSTGTSARWVIERNNVYTIICEELDDQGRSLGTIARYVQAVQSAEQAQQVGQFRQYLGDVSNGISRIQSGQEVAIRAVHINRESAAQTPLGLFIGTDASNPSQVKLVDLTPGASRMDYGGADAAAAIEDFAQGNRYPVGQIALSIPQNSQGIPPLNRQIEARGESLLRQLSGRLSWASLGLGVLSLLAAVGPGTQVAVPYLAVAALAAGGAGSALSLADEIRQTRPSAINVTIDVLGLASSILGGATAFQSIRQGAAITVATRPGQFLIYSGFTADAVAGVLISVEGVTQISQILSLEGMTPQQKADAIARVVANLAVQGALLAYGSRDLRANPDTPPGRRNPEEPNASRQTTPLEPEPTTPRQTTPPEPEPTTSRQTTPPEPNPSADPQDLGQQLSRALNRSLSEAEVNAAQQGRLNEQLLRPVVLSSQGWTQVKANYLQHPALMQQLINFREEVISGMIATLVRENPRFQMEALRTENGVMVGSWLEAIAPGSRTPTSDIDITFSARNGNVALEIEAVEQFNQRFRNNWAGLESGYVFDVNAYTTGHMRNAAFGSDAEKLSLVNRIANLLEKIGREGHTAPTQAEREDINRLVAQVNDHQDGLGQLEVSNIRVFSQQLDKLRDSLTRRLRQQYGEQKAAYGTGVEFDELEMEVSLVHVREFWQSEPTPSQPGQNPNQPSGWDTLREQMVDSATLPEGIRNQNRARFERAEATHAQLVAERSQLVEQLRRESPNRSETALEFEANNQLYQQYLERVKAKLAEIEALQAGTPEEQVRALRLELQRLQSTALFFANEAYVTAPAAEQVVLNQQLGLGLQLTPFQSLVSINEQVAFVGEQIAASQGNVGLALWKSAKYLDRILVAIGTIDDQTDALNEAMRSRTTALRQIVGPGEEQAIDGTSTLLGIKKSNAENLRTDAQKSEAALNLVRTSSLSSQMGTEQGLQQLVLDLQATVTLQVQQHSNTQPSN